MTFEARELYRSGNGDRWSLVRDPGSGLLFVRHEPNTASGGRTSDIGIGEFLVRGGHGPEHQELLHLIGTLVETTPSLPDLCPAALLNLHECARANLRSSE